MVFTFAEPSSLQSEFQMILLVFGSLVIIITAAFQVSYGNSPLAMSFKSRALLGLIGIAGVVWYAYASSYGHFYSAEISDSGLEMVFAGPFAERVIVPRRDVTAITYGLSDRGSSRCRVTIRERTLIHHSAWVPDKIGICRSYRDEMIRAMAGDSMTTQ